MNKPPGPGKPDAEARQAILAPAASKLIASTAGLDVEPLTFGRYDVVASIGKGGMGEVYLARVRGTTPPRLVALKVLMEEAGQDEELLAMFMDEASIMSQIHHPHVLEVFDFGRERGLYFIAMEYLQGRPLVRVMIDSYQRERGMDFGVIALIGADSARGLHAAHQAVGRNGQPLNVVHRDVSPQNIFVTYSGASKVIDFGVARASERFAHTVAGQLKGKAAYMSPEQVNGVRNLDARSDVFALGTCLWEMTAGRRLFKRGNDWETMGAVLEGPIVSPTRVRGFQDPYLDAIILRALERDADRRTPHAGVVEAELAAYARKIGAPPASVLVAELMKRLFGKEADEEKSLIRSLEDRSANDLEENSLRRLSGIAPAGKLQRAITLAARAEELAALDDTFASGPADPTDPTVAIPNPVLASLQAKARQSSTPGVRLRVPDEEPSSSDLIPPRKKPPPAPPSEDRTEVDGEEVDIDTLDGPTPSGIGLIAGDSAGGEPPTSPLEHQERAEAVRRAVEAIKAEHKALGKPWLDEPTQPLRLKGRAGHFLVAGLALMVLALAVVALRLGQQEPAGPGTLQGERRESDPSSEYELVPPEEPGAERVEVRRLEMVVVTPDDEALEEEGVTSSTRTAAPAPAAAARPARANGRSIDEVKATLLSLGVAVAASGGRVTIDDGGGNVAVSTRARVLDVGTEGANGWLITSDEPGFARVVWVGSINKGPIQARPISINDCPAAAAVKPNGVELAYGQHRVVVPHGGGPLEDLALERPAFATRLEIEPLGLAFGAADSGRPASLCADGWTESRVVLRRVPPGTYNVFWMGGGDVQVAKLTVTGPTEASKGRVKTISAPRRP